MTDLSEVLLGGIITLVGTGVVFYWQTEKEALLRREERSSKSSALVFSVQTKIVRASAIAKGICIAINDQLASANRNIEHDGVQINTIVGAIVLPDEFSSEELGLILKSGTEGLLENLLSIEWQARNLVELRREFNASRQEFSEFTRLHFNESTTALDSETFSSKVDAATAINYTTRAITLTQLVEEMRALCASLDQQCRVTLNEFNSAMAQAGDIAVHQVIIPETDPSSGNV